MKSNSKKDISTLINLNAHQQYNTNNGQEEFFCSCGKSFLQQHLEKHGENCDKNLTCNILSLKKNTDSKVHNLHLKNDHKNARVKKCKFCPLTFITINEYLTHIETIHQAGKKNYFMCSVCGKQYKTKSELTHHINSKCGTLKQFKCQICSQELMSAGSLYNHMLRHNGERSFMCRFCAKLFFTAGQLKVHERIHTQDKAYVCEVCNKGFCHRQSLITHSTLHTGIKPYQCENCGNSFSCVGNLIKHRKTHADSCGLVPLTTHRVKHPSTKIKVKINTPANSRLKTREKDIELEKELSTLKTELCRDKTDDTKNMTVPKLHGQFEKENENFNHSNSITLANEGCDDFKYGTSCNQNKNCGYCKTKSACDTDKCIVEKIPSEMDVKINKSMNTSLESENECFEDNSSDHSSHVKYDDSSANENDSIKNSEADSDNVTKAQNKKKSKYLKKKKYVRKDPHYEKVLFKFIEQTNFEKEGFGDCKYCGKRYMNVRWLYKHVKDHENNVPNGAEDKSGIPLHKCSCCKMSFYTKEESLVHQQITHADVLTCQDCEKIFANRDSLRSHQKVFHKGLGRKAYLYICEKCGKQFKQKSYLTCHEDRNCDKGPFYECSICKKGFSSRHTRNNHMRIHDPNKKLLCKFCAKSFHWKGQLKIHERSHTGEKPFACLYCPKAFAYRESLITHSSIHTGIKPHLCEGCGSRFSCIGNLIKHRSSHASECGAWTYKTQKPSQEISDNLHLK